MKFVELLRIVKNTPVFTTGLLLAGDVNKDSLTGSQQTSLIRVALLQSIYTMQ